MTREKDVFHWFGCLLTRQAKSPKAQGTCQNIHIFHCKFCCIISFGNILINLGGRPPFSPGINNARPPIHQEREVGGHVPIKQFAFFRSGIVVLRKDLLLFFQQQKNIILFEKIKSLQQTPPPGQPGAEYS